MIEKTTKDGQVLVYVVDRKTGAPHEGVSIEVTKSKQVLASGTTDKSGVFKTEVKQPTAKKDAEGETDQEESQKSAYLIMARERDNFVISDVESFYFSGEAGEDDAPPSQDGPGR